MNQTDDRSANRNDVVSEAIALVKKADEAKATAIQQLLGQREQIERDLKTLGYVAQQKTGGLNGLAPEAGGPAGLTIKKSTRFKNLTLAQIGRVLLKEHDSLHGKQIEELAKAAGFKGGTKNFQNYMPVAFKRDGGFQNIGGNTWKLKDPDA